MDKKSLKTSINIGLVVAFIGILVVFPFKDSHFITGLLFALCSASLIGGLADSFAVKAIFGQPLKIRWPYWMGTNIIARQRQRLIDELVHMVQDELLSPQAIERALKDKQLSNILHRFIQSELGQHTIRQLLQGAVTEAVQSKRIAVMLIGIKRLIAQMTEKSAPSRHVVTVVNYVYEQKLDDTIAAFIIRIVQPLLKSDEWRHFIEGLITAAISKYEAGNRRRQVANEIAKIDSKRLAGMLIDHIDQWLFELSFSDHPLRVRLKQACDNLVEQIEHNPDYAHKLDNQLSAFIKNSVNETMKGKTIETWLEQLEEAIISENSEHVAYRLSQSLIETVYEKINNLSIVSYDQHILSWLISIVSKNQHVVGKLVQEKLESYTAEQLIVLVEDKAGRDLQFIRLNGALVGGLIGGMLFVIQFVAGGGVG